MSPSRAGVRVVGSGAPDDDDDEGDASTSDGGRYGQRPDTERPRRRRPSALVVILVVLLLVALFGTVFFWSKYHSLQRQGRTEATVTKVSQDFLLALTNFQASTIDADFNRVQSFATGDFQSQGLSFFSTNIRQALAKVQAVSRGQIQNLFVQSIQGDTATTYATVDQTIANINFKAPEQDELRIVLTLRKLSAGWRISEVTVLQAPAVPTPTGPTTTKP